MNVIVPTLAVLFLISVAYTNGRRDGNQGGWSAAWRRARQRFHRRRRGREEQ